MADAFRQMQKKDWGDANRRGGRRRPYGCPCCQRFNVHRGLAKKLSRRQARVRLKRLDDDFVGARR